MDVHPETLRYVARCVPKLGDLLDRCILEMS